MNRSDFQRVAKIRLKEAKILLDNKCYEGAYYLAGYVIECALKACIAKRTKRFEFPPKPKEVSEYYQHNLEVLIKSARLESDLNTKRNSVMIFDSYWKIVIGWSEQDRYESKIDRHRANDLYVAITAEPHGVLAWLKKYW